MTLSLLDVLLVGVLSSSLGIFFLLDKPFIGIFPKTKELINIFHILVTSKILILNSVLVEKYSYFVCLAFVSLLRVMQKWIKESQTRWGKHWDSKKYSCYMEFMRATNLRKYTLRKKAPDILWLNIYLKWNFKDLKGLSSELNFFSMTVKNLMNLER